MKLHAFVAALLALVLAGCSGSCSCNPPAPDAGPSDAAPPDAPTAGFDTKVVVSNMTDAGAVVNISIGADSKVMPAAWSFCGVDAGLTCSFPLPASGSQALPTGGQYLNASVAFNGPVGCGSTIAEVTANTGNGYGTADVSLVNGWNADVQITVNGQTLGPATKGDMSKVSGVFPNGCDVCVARQKPPCGIKPCGSSPNDGGQACGCKTGSQYNPTVPCQITYQKADAGSLVNIALVP